MSMKITWRYLLGAGSRLFDAHISG